MRRGACIRPVELGLGPLEAVRAWPAAAPLCCALSVGGKGGDEGGRGGGGEGGWARWSILAAPSAVHRLDGGDALERMRSLVGATRVQEGGGPGSPPFVGGWMALCSYELGRVIEPAAGVSGGSAREGGPSSGWPLVTLLRCPGAYVFDNVAGRWWVVGDDSGLPAASELASAAADLGADGYRLGRARFTVGREAYEGMVARAVEYIHAGDIFQANIAHALEAGFSGSARALFADLAHTARPWYGAYAEDTQGDGDESIRRAAASVSPELFIQMDAADRRIITRPIKGTRPGDADPGALRESAKDAAELAMIVDLMRNDLGRVCAYGSIRVREAAAVERHASGAGAVGVLHGVATVEGRMRGGVDLVDVLRATFPGGSITGAPKVRAMQVIDELEGVPRGLYTGAIGYISDTGDAAFNIAIRTAVVEGAPAEARLDAVRDGCVRYGVGAGIVADSDPASEWAETLAKAEVFMNLAGEASGDVKTGATGGRGRGAVQHA